MGKGMKSPTEVWLKLKSGIKKEWKIAFLSAFVIGLLIHMPMMLQDIPNHDGLASMYFDQNMITSGRWFLGIACGFSSYFTLPWVIGLLGLFWLSLTAVVLVEILDIRRGSTVVLTSGLLVAFPAVASTFAYVFTLDGYMMGIFLAVMAVLLTQKFRYGYLAGGISLAFSMGIYQAYLPFAILLSLYSILCLLLAHGTGREKIKKAASYLGMGVWGVGLYYVLLQILLKIQGKELASYQGIDGMGNVIPKSIGDMIRHIYADFASFTLWSGVVVSNLFSMCAVVVLILLILLVSLRLVWQRKLWKSPWFYVFVLAFALVLPLGTNIILVISPEVNYHLLMRYQWVLFLILGIAFIDKYLAKETGYYALSCWLLGASACVLLLSYTVTDNIAYSNLNKKYEKTYAYCLRLLDRMEQTEGYYQGIPVAMIGVVGDTQYPVTDITGEVTGSMIGIPGDLLLYQGTNYQAFLKHYLGVEIQLVDQEEITRIYDSPAYLEMDSFPGKDAVRIVDGVMYIKTENQH